MRKLRRDVDRDAVQRYPLAHADADGGDLVLAAFATLRPAHPNADAVLAPLATYVEDCQRSDDPFLQRGDEGAHVGLAPVEVEHDVGHALAGAVVGELAAAADVVHRKARLDQLRRLRAGTGGVERRMLQQPD